MRIEGFKINQELRTKSRAILDEIVDEIVVRAKEKAPVRSGKLRDSIKKIKISDTEDQIIVDVPYSLGIEAGTATKPANPFIRPAVDEVLRRGK